MLLTWAPGVLRSAGLQVNETSGWTSRSHGQFPDSISGVWHHDASPPGDSPGSLNWMISNWNSASANFWVDRKGCWYCVGAGVAYHAGSVLSGMPGNSNAFGVETDQTINEVPAAAMLDATRRGFAALLKYMKRNAQSMHFHKTIASPKGRKIDPWFDKGSDNQNNWSAELNRERANIQTIMDGGSVGPTPPPDGGDNSMANFSEEDIVRLSCSGYERAFKESLIVKLNNGEVTTLEQFCKNIDQRTWTNEQFVQGMESQGYPGAAGS